MGNQTLKRIYTEVLTFPSFWADGYFAETIGQVNEEVVKKYIRDQQEWGIARLCKGPETTGFSPWRGSF